MNLAKKLYDVPLPEACPNRAIISAYPAHTLQEVSSNMPSQRRRFSSIHCTRLMTNTPTSTPSRGASPASYARLLIPSTISRTSPAAV